MKISEVRNHVSYSSISKYMKCSMQWYYDYVIAPEKKIETLPMKIGIAYHKALEKLYLDRDYDGGLLILEDLAKESGKYARRDISAIINCYKDYYLKVYPLYQSRVDRVEVEGSVNIPGIGVPLDYRMDLLTTDGIVIDHKTVGRIIPDIEYSLQFDLYAYAYYKEYGRLPSRVEYHNAFKNVGSVEVRSKIPNVVDMMKAVSCVVGVVKAIEADVFIPFYGRQCAHCPHKEMCDYEHGKI